MKNYLKTIFNIIIFILFIFIFQNNIFSQNPYYKKYINQKKSLNVYNWGEYINDGSNGDISVNREFEKLTGIKINYSTFSSNEELYAKLRNKSSNYDIIIASDYMISRMIIENMIQKIDINKIPNFKNIDDNFKNPNYDKNNEHSVPYMWGTVGIIYNKSKIDKPIDSWSDLWDPNFKGKILMFSNSRDCFGVALKKLNYSINTTDKNQIIEASREISAQKELVQAYVMDEIFNKMENEEAYIAPYYSGDAIRMMNENENLDFVHPKEGTNKFVDAICIPNGSQNTDPAYLYINFLLEPEIALSNVKYIGYSTPNKEAYKLLDNKTKNNKIAYPDEYILKNTESFLHLPKEINKLIDSEWTKIMSINSVDNKWLVPIFLIIGLLLSISINIYRLIKKRKKYNIKF